MSCTGGRVVGRKLMVLVVGAFVRVRLRFATTFRRTVRRLCFRLALAPHSRMNEYRSPG